MQRVFNSADREKKKTRKAGSRGIDKDTVSNPCFAGCLGAEKPTKDNKVGIAD